MRRSREIEKVEKEISKLVSAGKTKEARELLPKAQKALDKAAKKGTIKANTASRKISRLSAFVKKASVK